MDNIFPQLITNLPEADMPIPGCHIYISQAEEHQVVFMKFEEDAVVPEHAHASQWEFVLAGEVEMTIGGVTNTYKTGDGFVVPDGVAHSGKIHAGYASVAYFQQKDRYKAK